MAGGALIVIHLDQVERTLPRVQSTKRVAEGKGVVDSTHDWYLVVTNHGSKPARQLRCTLSAAVKPGEPWEAGKMEVDVLPGNGAEARFIVVPTRASSPRVVCKVTWLNSRGRVRDVSETLEMRH
jgi:hypothetical protein